MVVPLSYDVHMDSDGFKDLFRASLGRLMRRWLIVALVLLIGFLPIAILMVSMDPSGSWPLLVGDLALAECCIAFMRRPPVALSTRRSVVDEWFMYHGVRNVSAIPLNGLSCSYRVTLGEHGFTESMADGSRNVPWLALTDKPARGDDGIYFFRDGGLNSSALYNLIGINWAFRDEGVVSTLFVPNSVVDANPDLVPSIRTVIRESYARYQGGKGVVPDLALRTWITESSPRAHAHDVEAGI